jgi:ribonuclease HI
MTMLRLYTDGSCPAPGAVGGWAWLLVREHPVASGSGKTPGPSTHQRCELTAAIEALATWWRLAYARLSCSPTADRSSAG